MEFKKIGELAIPFIGFGTFKLRGDECTKSVLTALETGYRLIDTAEAYGNESEVGKAIKESGIRRDELFITTKVNFKSYEHARETVEKSLEKLGVDKLDLVLLHWGFGNYYKAWRELEKLVHDGVIGAIGVSNFTPVQLIDLVSFNEIKPIVNQTETNLYCQRINEHTWEDKYGIAHEGYAPLGQGRANEMFAEPAVAKLAGKYGKTPAQVLLRFFTQSDVIVIPKSAHAERIHENFSIFDFSLTESELAELRVLDKASPMIGRSDKPEMVESAMKW